MVENIIRGLVKTFPALSPSIEHFELAPEREKNFIQQRNEEGNIAAVRGLIFEQCIHYHMSEYAKIDGFKYSQKSENDFYYDGLIKKGNITIHIDYKLIHNKNYLEINSKPGAEYHLVKNAIQSKKCDDVWHMVYRTDENFEKLYPVCFGSFKNTFNIKSFPGKYATPENPTQVLHLSEYYKL